MGERPDDRRPPLRGEDLFLSLLCTAAGPLLWWSGTTAVVDTPSGGGIQFVERSVASLCVVAGALIAAWWFVAVLGAVLASCGHRWQSARLGRLAHVGRTLSPAFLRRVAASVLGVNVLLAPGAWAADGPGLGLEQSGPPAAPTALSPVAHSVAPHPGWRPRPAAPSVWSTVAPSAAATSGATPATGELASATLDSRVDPSLPTPAWKPETPTPATPGSTRTARPSAEEPTTLSVRHGDCLWDIAAHELGPTATDLEVDRRWRQWYHHNRSLIGAEADLLLPGTVLTAPPFD
ncbi:LysM peptidoglycan-binding domain-containing protein [Microbacterium sp. A93]|uniref:LysM peptidoglycan-binding domain-containing protein n=1 Tax=Microbacterium sp. A93 TaxID=3450716 RepID=UPI003F43FBD6